MEMAEGEVTVTQNLREVIGGVKDVEATWLPVPLDPKEWIGSTPLARIPPFSSSWSLQRALLTRSRIRSLEEVGGPFDAAYFNAPSPAFFLRQFRRRTPFVSSMDATPIALSRYGYYKPLADGNPIVGQLRHRLTVNVFRRASQLLTYSAFTKKSLIKDYGIEEDKISVVPPGVNLRVWSRHTMNSQRGNHASGRLQVLFVGRNFERKGGDLLLNIARRKDFEQCDFHLVASDSHLPNEKNIFVHANMKTNSEPLLALYCQADIFVLPTRADFSPNVICEAMAMELPVISTRVGGVDEMIIEGETGFTVPVDDEDAFSDRLRALTDNAGLRARLGSNGRRLVESSFNLETNAEVIVEYLRKAAYTKQI
jgi:glycosyltransferase involved in cell wall biosynthesis